MTEQDNYFEIGRGAKLIPMEYWHQYVLGIDPTEESNFLVVSEVGKNEILYKNKITIEEIRNSHWNELLDISKTKSFISQLIGISSDNEQLVDIINSTVKNINQTKEQLNGNWISINEYGNLNYNSNFGNWVDAVQIKGKLKFTLDLDSLEGKNCHIGIPVNYLSTGDGYFSIQMGRFELSKNQILIWQNDIFPSQINYDLVDDELILELYENKIRFIKE